MTHNLKNLKSKYVLNYITYKLAEALGYERTFAQQGQTIEADPDEVLDQAIRTIVQARVAANIVTQTNAGRPMMIPEVFPWPGE